MHRFIFIATLLPAVFLVDLLASSVWLPDFATPAEPEKSFELTLNATLSAINPPEMTRATPVRRGNAEFICTDEVFAFMLDHIRALEEDKKRLDNHIREDDIGNCNQLFHIAERVDLDRDGESELIIQADLLFWSTARSDLKTWVVRKTNGGYEVMLDAGFVMIITAERKRVGNHPVLTIDRHAGAERFVTGSYEYRAGNYRLAKCTSYRLGDYRAERRELSYCE